MHDELGEGSIERPVPERQLFCGRLQHGDTGVTRAGGRDKWLRGVDGRDRRRAKPCDKLGR